MTVPTPAALIYIDNADGVTTSFSYPVRFLDKAEIVVLLRDDDGDTLQFLGTDYTIAGSSWPTGGNIVFNPAPPSGKKVVRYRNTTAKQVVDLENTQRNDAGAVEMQLDRLAMVQQDQGRDIGRSLKVPAGSGLLPKDHFPISDGAGGVKDGGAATNVDSALADLFKFRGQYLGEHASDPSTDANGNAIQQGAFYWNTASKVHRYWDGNSWETFPFATVADEAVTEQKLADDAITEPKLADALAVTMAPVVNDRSALKALNTARYNTAWLSEGKRSGLFKWSSGDQSAVVAPRSFTATASNSTDEFTATGHRLKTGDSIVPRTTAYNVAANTRYYAIRLSSSRFYVATSRANALAGTLIALTGDGDVTFDVVPDDLEGDVVIKAEDSLAGVNGAWLRMKEHAGVYVAQHFGLETGGATDNSESINVALFVAQEFGGGSVKLPAGNIYMTETIYPRRLTWLEGVGKQATILDWHGLTADYAIDGFDDGTDGAYPNDRLIFCVRDLTVSGANADASSSLQGVRLGRNHRAAPVLERVKIMGTPHHGLNLDADNWNIDIVDVEVDTCARLRDNASGVHKNPAVTDINHINFTRLRVEGCGNPSSAAGGMNISSTALYTNRGWQFTNCQAEGNFGSDEVYFSNMRGLYFNGWYMEVIDSSGHTIGVEFNNCTGLISGGQIIAEAGSPTSAIKITHNDSRMTVMAIDFGDNWSYLIDAFDASVVRYAQLVGAASNRANDTSTITAM